MYDEPKQDEEQTGTQPADTGSENAEQAKPEDASETAGEVGN